MDPKWSLFIIFILSSLLLVDLSSGYRPPKIQVRSSRPRRQTGLNNIVTSLFSKAIQKLPSTLTNTLNTRRYSGWGSGSGGGTAPGLAATAYHALYSKPKGYIGGTTNLLLKDPVKNKLEEDTAWQLSRIIFTKGKLMTQFMDFQRVNAIKMVHKFNEMMNKGKKGGFPPPHSVHPIHVSKTPAPTIDPVYFGMVASTAPPPIGVGGYGHGVGWRRSGGGDGWGWDPGQNIKLPQTQGGVLAKFGYTLGSALKAASRVAKTVADGYAFGTDFDSYLRNGIGYTNLHDFYHPEREKHGKGWVPVNQAPALPVKHYSNNNNNGGWGWTNPKYNTIPDTGYHNDYNGNEGIDITGGGYDDIPTGGVTVGGGGGLDGDTGFEVPPEEGGKEVTDAYKIPEFKPIEW